MIRAVDRWSAVLAGGLLAGAAAWAFSSAVTEKEKGACAVLLLCALLVALTAWLVRVSVAVTFMIRAPAAIAAFAMTVVVPAEPRIVVFAALVGQAVSLTTVVGLVMEETRNRPVSHL